MEPRKSASFYGLCSKYFLRGSVRNRELEFDFWLFEAQMVAGIFGYWSRLIFIESRNLYGRYDRLNSWDLVSHPTLVFERLAAALQRERLLFILGFTFIQIMSLVFLSKNHSK